MSRVLLSLPVLAMLLACSGSDGGSTPAACTTCIKTPDAKAADDAKPSGVYKGILASDALTGTVKADIKTDQSGGTATAIVNGATKTASNFVKALTGQADTTTGANVTYTFSSADFTLVLVLDAAGKVVQATLTVGTDTVGLAMMKESSTQLVECFEGTYGGTQQGKFNLAATGNILTGVAWGTVDHVPLSGTVSGSEYTITVGTQPVASGSRSGDDVSGTWDSGDGESGTWDGSRTM